MPMPPVRPEPSYEYRSAVDRLLVALDDGDRAAQLTELLRAVATGMDNAIGSEVASISREIRAILGDLDRAGAGRKESTVDDLAARRAARLAAGSAGAEDPGSAAVGGDFRP